MLRLSNLDQAAAGDLVALLREIHSRGTTVVLATHVPQLIALAEVVYELESGKVKEV